jgi:ubiquinone/menaquinone biosynthesis C-methylase UbiE
MPRSVDYDAVAPTYDRRYAENDYSGIERALLQFVGDTPRRRVLEVGCGTGHWLAISSRGGTRVAGVDASAQMLARAQAHVPGASLVRGSAEHLPWADASFDRLFCINALHHFRDHAAFLAEARRVLRPGGGVMTVGLDPHTGRDRWCIYDYFEGTRATDAQRYPAATRIRDWLSVADFSDCVTVEVQHLAILLPARESLEQGRLDQHVTSQLSVLTEAAYQRGIDRIRSDLAAAEARGESLFLTADLRLYATFGWVRP